jgi:DNA relaxase NicK
VVVTVRVDWLRATGQASVFKREEWEILLASEFGPVDLQPCRGLYGYSDGWAVVEKLTGGDAFGLARTLGRISYGGPHQKGTCCLDVTGVGCEVAYARRGRRSMEQLRFTLPLNGFKLTRVDVCADFIGEGPDVNAAREAWERGEFDYSGRRPKARDLVLREQCARGAQGTMYVGARESECFRRVYDKGEEQGCPDPSVVRWYRWEAEFKRSSLCELEWSVLADPANALLEAFPMLGGWVTRAADAVRVRLRKARATGDRVIEACKRQYGKLLYWLRKEFGSAQAVFELVAMPGTPRAFAGATRGDLALGGAF